MNEWRVRPWCIPAQRRECSTRQGHIWAYLRIGDSSNQLRREEAARALGKHNEAPSRRSSCCRGGMIRVTMLTGCRPPVHGQFVTRDRCRATQQRGARKT